MTLSIKIIISAAIALAIGFYALNNIDATNQALLLASYAAAGALGVLVTSFIKPDTSSSVNKASSQKGSGTPKSGRQTGEVKWFNGGKGFGFITCNNGDELFVHFRSIRKGSARLAPGKSVEFSVITGKKGEEADDVLVI